MGIIKILKNTVSGSIADQFLEVIEPGSMDDKTVFTSGIPVRKDNKRGSETVANGSVVHVYPNQFMLLMDGGKIVDYTAEEGYYHVDNSSAPSALNGEFGEALRNSFDRLRFGGVTPQNQKVFYLNLQEIKGIKFGTRTPINYFDTFYNAELFLRTHGSYSIKITDPIRFYAEAIPKSKTRVQITDINEQYMAEFLEALQGAINRLSADGERISFVSSKGRELSQYMQTILDEEWNLLRGFNIQRVGIASISYDEESTKLINMRNKGAMLADPTVREGFMQGSVARGLEAAGSNANGAMAGFMGMNMGMQGGGGFMQGASQMNQQHMQQQFQQQGQHPGQPMQQGQPHGQPMPQGQPHGQPIPQNQPHGQPMPQGQPVPSGAPASASWTCTCNAVNSGRFCAQCGTPKPEPKSLNCNNCGHSLDSGARPPKKFCPECGTPVAS